MRECCLRRSWWRWRWGRSGCRQWRFPYQEGEDIPKAIYKLKNGTATEKVKAAQELGDRGAVRITDVKDAVEPLKNLLGSDNNAKVRAAAAEALGKIAPEPAETVKLLLNSLKDDKDEEVKIAEHVFRHCTNGTRGQGGHARITEICQGQSEQETQQRREAGFEELEDEITARHSLTSRPPRLRAMPTALGGHVNNLGRHAHPKRWAWHPNSDMIPSPILGRHPNDKVAMVGVRGRDRRRHRLDPAGPGGKGRRQGH